MKLIKDMSVEEKKSFGVAVNVLKNEVSEGIDNKKIDGKNGYDLFNTIFFERHKEILLRSG